MPPAGSRRSTSGWRARRTSRSSERRSSPAASPKAHGSRRQPRPPAPHRRDVAAGTRSTSSLDGLASWFADGYDIAHRSAPAGARGVREDTTPRGDQRWSWLAPILAPEVWDDELWEQLTAGVVGYAPQCRCALRPSVGPQLPRRCPPAGGRARGRVGPDRRGGRHQGGDRKRAHRPTSRCCSRPGGARRDGSSELAAVRLDDVPAERRRPGHRHGRVREGGALQRSRPL